MARKKNPSILGLLNIKDIKRIAKQLDTPEMRELYRRQKISNPDLDSEIDEMTKDLDEYFKHNEDSENE